MKKTEYQTTTNSSIFKKLHKEKFASCSYCKWHPTFWKFSENDHWKSFYKDNDDKITRKPNWKLVSKNRKQWMNKPLKIKKYQSRFTHIIYEEIIW